MEIREAKLLYNANFTLGEGAFWHNDWQQFVFIDIKGKKLGRINADGTGLALRNLPKMPGVVRAITADKLVIAWQGELVTFDFETEATEVLQLLEPEIPTNRSNDGNCDANGRFWFGTMDTSAKLNAGNFYCYDGKLQRKLAETSVSNGICWSVDHKTLYYIDSFDFNIKAYNDGESKSCCNYAKQRFSA
jgi:sugar lactone lactonase YvrE